MEEDGAQDTSRFWRNIQRGQRFTSYRQLGFLTTATIEIDDRMPTRSTTTYSSLPPTSYSTDHAHPMETYTWTSRHAHTTLYPSDTLTGPRKNDSKRRSSTSLVPTNLERIHKFQSSSTDLFTSPFPSFAHSLFHSCQISLASSPFPRVPKTKPLSSLVKQSGGGRSVRSGWLITSLGLAFALFFLLPLSFFPCLCAFLL